MTTRQNLSNNDEIIYGKIARSLKVKFVKENELHAKLQIIKNL